MAVVMYGCDTRFLVLGEEHKLRVSENGVLRKILGFRKNKVKGEWRRLHNEGLYDLYSPLNIIQVMKSSSVRWIGAYTMNGGGERGIQGFGGGNLRGRDHVGDLGIDRRIILKWNFQMWDWRAWSLLVWFWIGIGGGLL